MPVKSSFLLSTEPFCGARAAARTAEHQATDPAGVKRQRAYARAYGRRHRKRLRAKRKARYHTDLVWRERKRAYNREWLRNRQRRRKEHATADEEGGTVRWS